MNSRAIMISLVGRAVLLIGVGGMTSTGMAGPPAFEVTLSPNIRGEAFTGRVYVFTSRNHEPRRGPDWFHPEPFLARDVVDLLPGQPIRLAVGSDTLTFPKDLAGQTWDGVRIQAVARLNPRERNVGTGPGNAFSEATTIRGEKSISLTISHVVPDQRFAETRWSRELAVHSKLLSRFHGRDVYLRACVTLPASYDEAPLRRYPTLLIIPGFGGTHQQGRRTEPVAEVNERGVEFLRVTLDPSCPLGHHVFADSANNGPVGRALIEEFLPELDRQYRTVAAPPARFLTGHSSGGWSSLWLQVTYPESFGGVWSTAPDPVDFRDFQRIDLYRPGVSMYVDADGDRRPLAEDNGQVLVWYDDFAWMEHVLGPGGQLHSFEAVFSPRGANGQPRLLWDRETGQVDPATAQTWENYDIRLVLQRNWQDRGPRLTGKLHLLMGAADTFLLEGATRRLAETLKQLGSDAVVEIHPGKDHRTLLTRELRERIRAEMTAAFLSTCPNWPGDDQADR